MLVFHNQTEMTCYLEETVFSFHTCNLTPLKLKLWDIQASRTDDRSNYTLLYYSTQQDSSEVLCLAPKHYPYQDENNEGLWFSSSHVEYQHWMDFIYSQDMQPWYTNPANRRHWEEGAAGMSESRNILEIMRLISDNSWCSCCPCLLFYSLLSSSHFLSFIPFCCSSHSLSQHLLGLCKYCHCEILQALIDCGWGLIIPASYKDIFDKINAAIREAKSLQWYVPLSFFNGSLPTEDKYLFPLCFYHRLRFFNFFIYSIEITLGSWTGVIGCMKSCY